jgi:hypothetical protein
MGIVTRDLRPKPACLAFATLTGLLKGMRFAGPVGFEVPSGVYAFRFMPDARASRTGRAERAEIMALWSPKQDANIMIPVKSQSIELVNTIGESRPISSQSDHTEVKLLAGKVVYVSFEPHH